MLKNFRYRDRNGLIYMTYLLILINTGVLLIQSLFPSFQNLFMLHPLGTESHWIFQYFTACFLHANFIHLLMNMMALYFFGVFMEERFGRIKFISLYLVSGVLANILWHTFSSPDMPALGASGAVFGIFAALAMFVPNQKVLAFFIIPAKLWMVVSIVLLIEIVLMIFPIEGDNMGHMVHVMGALVGVLYYIFFLRKHR